MARMRAVEAAIHVLEQEGITALFGVPGAAINPFYAAMRKRNSLKHTLARHVEGASHMAEGYTRAAPGNIGVCVGTSGPAGTDMVTGLYSAWADSIPILCIVGQAPRARLYKEDFQAVDIEFDRQTRYEMGDNSPRACPSPARFPAGLPSHAFWAARSSPDRLAVRRANGRDRIRSRDVRATTCVQAARHPRAGRKSLGYDGAG